MHIPDLEKAVSELSRVLSPKGTLLVYENSMHNFQSFAARSLARYLIKGVKVKKTPAGVEFWRIGPQGTMFTRTADIKWLIKGFESNGLSVSEHFAGQFTTLYVQVPSQQLKNLIHFLNNFWFRRIKIPRPAVGNIIILQKEK